MNCEHCAWYVWRPVTAVESEWLRQHPGHIIDTRFCTLGGCDGSMFHASADMRGGQND